MIYGLTEKGFRVKYQPEIMTEMISDTLQNFGQVQTDPSSVIGQLLGVYSKPAIDVWEQLGNIYLALNPESATGISLDYCCAFNGVFRLPALKSTVTIGLFGADGSIIPENTQVKSSLVNKLFATTTEVTILKTGLQKCYLQINELIEYTDYAFTINAVEYLINSGIAPNGNTIIQALVDQVNSEGYVTATNLGSNSLAINAVDEAFEIEDITENLDFYFPVNAQSIDSGIVPVSIRTIDTIETPVVGLDEVLNFEAGVPGRAMETDAELRIRRKNSIQISGAATLQSIVSRILREVTGVTACKGYENVTDSIDYALVTFEGDLVTGNIIDLKVNGSYIGWVTFAVNHETTMGLIASAIAAKTAVVASCTVTAARELTIKKSTDTDIAISDIYMYGGATQTTGTFTKGSERPPHSIEIIVMGGTKLAIATKLWEIKGAGIQTHGNTSQEIIDSNGDPQIMNFSIPVSIQTQLHFDVELYDEEIFPADGLTLVRQYAYEYGLTFPVGLDVIAQRFVPTVITQIPGILKLSVYVQTDLIAWTDIIPIGENEIATFSLDDITAELDT